MSFGMCSMVCATCGGAPCERMTGHKDSCRCKTCRLNEEFSEAKSAKQVLERYGDAGRCTDLCDACCDDVNEPITDESRCTLDAHHVGECECGKHGRKLESVCPTRTGPYEKLSGSDLCAKCGKDLLFDKETSLTGDADIDEFLQECLRTMKSKGRDYTLGKLDVDRLYNFRSVGDFVGLDMMHVWSVYFAKHIFAIFNYIKSGGKSESEPIESRILDCVVYCLLLLKIVKESKHEKI